MKRWISFLLALTLFLQPSIETRAIGHEPPVFRVETVTASKGDSEVKVNVLAEGNPGIASAKLIISYDDEVLELTNVEYNSEWGGMSQAPQYYKSPLTLNWFNGVANTTLKDSVYATLTFDVAANADIGTSEIELSYNPEDVYNIEEDNVYFEIVKGGITIEESCTDLTGEFGPNASMTLSLEGEVFIEYIPDVSNFSIELLKEGNGGLAIWKGNSRPASSSLVMPDADNCETLKNMHWSEALDAWVFTSMGIPAKKYGDTLYMRPFIELPDGTYITGGILVYSPETFCKNKLTDDKTQVNLKVLCAAILEYGASAQNYFDYKDKDDTVNGEDLVNYEGSVKLNYNDYFDNADAQLAYSAEVLDELVPLPSGFGAQFESGSIRIASNKDFAQATLTLEGAVVIDVINYDVPIENIDHALLQVWSEEDLLATKDFTYDADSCTLKVEMEYGELVNKEGYVASMKSDNYVGIPAKECGNTVYFMTYFVTEDGTIYRNGMRKYSPDEFVRSKVEGAQQSDNEELKDLCKRLAVYSEKARIYFD